MKLVVHRGVATIDHIPASVKTENHWVDAFLPLLVSMPKEMTFSTTLQFKGVSKARAIMGERVFRCLWLVWMSSHVSDDYYPQDPEQTSNFEMKPGTTWRDVPVVKKYVNTRLKNVFDPEFLVLLWSKQLENFDANDRALLPTYPKDLYNRPFRPEDVRDVVRQLQFSSKTTRVDAPALFALVDDPFGYEVLETVYGMLTGPRHALRPQIEAFKKKHPETEKWKMGFFFAGMSEILLRPECLLSAYLLSRFFYLPPRDIFALYGLLEPSVLDFIETLSRETAFKDTLRMLDVDPKTMKPVYTPQHFWFADKKVVRAYLQKIKKPNYYRFLEDTMRLFACKEL